MKLLILKKIHNGLLYTSTCYYKTGWNNHQNGNVSHPQRAKNKEQWWSEGTEEGYTEEEVGFLQYLQKFERIGYRLLISSYAVLFFCWVFSTCTGSARGLASWHEISYLNMPMRTEAGSPEALLGYGLKMKINIGHWHSVLLTGFPGKVLITSHGTAQIDDKKQNGESDSGVLINV